MSPTGRSRWLALIVLCAGMLMIVLDVSVVNVALPSMKRELGFSQSTLAWIVNAYLIPFGGLLLLAGRLGDLIGRKRMFLAGLVVFTLASFLCGVSGSQGMLIAARLVQGVGGAMTSTVILGVIFTMFTDPREQARAVGIFSFTASAGGSIGLLLGGVITQSVSWHWIFFVNVPIGILALVLAVRLIESDRGIGLAQGADVLGAVLVTSALMLGVYTIVEVVNYGWVSLNTLGLGAVSLLLLAGFLVRQARADGLLPAGFVFRHATTVTPLLPLRVFRSRNVSGANLIQILLVPGMFGMFFMGALYLQLVQGYGPLQIGLAFLPGAATIGALSFRFTSQLINRVGARPVTIAGLVLLTAGLVLFVRLPLHASYPVDVLPGMLLTGIGIGLCFPALMQLGMSGATPSDSGLISGLINTTAQVGGSLGLAVVNTLATSRTISLTTAGHSLPEALLAGYQLAFAVAAGLVVAAIVVAATVLRPSGVAQPVEETPVAEQAA